MHAEKKSRLGRGLDALLGGNEPSRQDAERSPGVRQELDVQAIEPNPFQPRKSFDEEELSSLRESIKHHGVLQPLVVRQVGERYQLVAGERRLRAAQEAGLSAVPVTIVDFNDQQSYEAALVENLQRADLNPIDKAQGFRDYLTRYEMTHEQLANRLGLARSTITNLVALLELPQELQDAVRVGQLTLGHAKILKGVTDPLKQQAAAREIIARGLSVHATEAFVKQMGVEEKEANNGSPATAKGSGSEKTAHVVGIEDELRQKLGTKVEIRVKGKDRGQVLIGFESNEDFERIVEMLRR